MKFILIFWIITFIAGCSSEPKVPVQQATPGAPSWTAQPARTYDEDQSEIIFIGIGEDRDEQNAHFKSEAIALQDLANECSFVPKTADLQKEHYETSMGLIYRSYARVRISFKDCESAERAENPEQIRALASPELQAEIASYQGTYDAPEPEEGARVKPERASQPIADTSQLFIARQQIALAKQDIILKPNSPGLAPELVQRSSQVLKFETTHPDLKAGFESFSTERPNWNSHSAQAVRETLQERTRLKQEYNYTPTPVSPGPQKPSRGRGGRGSRRGGQQTQSEPSPPPNPGPGSQPSPIPSL